MSVILLTVLSAAVCAPEATERKEPDPRSTLETAIPYFITLLEEDKIDTFIDEAIHPDRLKDYIERAGREVFRENVRKGQKETIEMLRKLQKIKGKPFKPYSEKDEAGMKFEVSIPPELHEFGKPTTTITFYKRNGLWYGL